MSEHSPRPGIVRISLGEVVLWDESEGRLPPGEMDRRMDKALRAMGERPRGQRQDYAGPPEPEPPGGVQRLSG